MTRAITCSFIFTLFVSLIAGQITNSAVIDRFTTPQRVSTSIIGVPESDIIPADGSFIGPQRTLEAEKMSGSNAKAVTCIITPTGEGDIASFSLNSDTGLHGRCTVSYGPFTPQNYTANGADCWMVKIIEADKEADISVCGITGGRSLCSTLQLFVEVRRSAGVYLCLPFLGGESYDGITGLELELASANVPSLDIEISFTCASPRISCWHVIDTLGNRFLSIGSMIGVMIFCENFDSVPATTEPINIAFPFPPSIGEIIPNSGLCQITNGSFNVIRPAEPHLIADNVFRVNATLDEQERIGCSYMVDIVGVGETGDLWADVTVFNTGAMFKSNENINRVAANDDSFCMPPIPSNLTIQLPPTTLPPTTTSPTTSPPTTAPPTTEPPTTNPPTTLPPTTLAPTTLPPTTTPPTTQPPTTLPPTTLPPTTLPPTTMAPTTLPPTTRAPTTRPPTTLAPTTNPPTTMAPTTLAPTTLSPTTLAPTTNPPTTRPPTTLPPTTLQPTTRAPTTNPPTLAPTTNPPTTRAPTTMPPTTIPPTNPPTNPPTLPPTLQPTTNPPTTMAPTVHPTTLPPTTLAPTTLAPTIFPPTMSPTQPPTMPPSIPPTTLSPTTLAPTNPPTNPPTLPPTNPPTLPPTNPPTTMAPPTLPPTFAPTIPPATNPPTVAPTMSQERVCIFPKIMNGTCICETDVCVQHNNGIDYTCGARGWYCFVTYPGQTIRVTYRGEECYCVVP